MIKDYTSEKSNGNGKRIFEPASSSIQREGRLRRIRQENSIVCLYLPWGGKLGNSSMIIKLPIVSPTVVGKKEVTEASYNSLEELFLIRIQGMDLYRIIFNPHNPLISARQVQNEGDRNSSAYAITAFKLDTEKSSSQMNRVGSPKE